MDHRTENGDGHASRFGTTLRSLSHHTLHRESKSPVQGLKKLATSYRNSVKSNKLEIEKLRNAISHMPKDKRTDTRFRRERARSPKKVSQSPSVSHVSGARYVEQPITESSPTFSLQNIHSPKDKTKELQHDIQPAPTKGISPHTNDMNVSSIPQKATELPVDKDAISSSLENQAGTMIKSKNDACSSSSTDVKRKGAKWNKENGNNSLTLSSLSGSIKKRNSWGTHNIVKLNYLNKSPYWDDPRLLKKYANLIGVKKTRSSMTLPFMLPKLPDGMCMCMKCSCVRDSPEEYTFDNMTIEGSNSITLDQEALFKQHLNGSYYMVFFYIVGCLCGLSLVALIAWLLSNDVIWSYVNYQREVPTNHNFVYTFVSYIEGAVSYAFNFVFGGIYNVFVLPRNAVFNISEEPWMVWKYLKEINM